MRILEVFETILIVLGISAIYPRVNIDNLYIYKKDNAVYVSFEAHNLINDSIEKIIRSGIPVNLYFHTSTTDKKNVIFDTNYIYVIRFQDDTFYLNGELIENSERLITSISKNTFVILDNIESESGKRITTQIDISISADKIPNLNDLWGNQPKITLNYRL